MSYFTERGLIDIDAPIEGCPNVSWRELVRTVHRKHAEANAHVPVRLQGAGEAIAEAAQAVRSHYERPISFHSGYRCPALNDAVGGSENSQHMRFEAIDFHIVGKPLDVVFDWIVHESGIAFGQAILEGYALGKPSWIHLSLGAPWRPAAKCGQALVSYDGGATFTRYWRQ